MRAEANFRRHSVPEQSQQWKDRFLKPRVPGKMDKIKLFLSSEEVTSATTDSLLLWVHERFPGGRFSKVPKLYGPFSGVTIPFVSQERRGFNSSNFTVIFLFVTLKTC